MTRMLRAGVLCLLLASLGAAPAAAEAPELLSYQGVLTLNDGTVVGDGDYGVVFRIFDNPTAGNELYKKSLTVGVKDGLYNVLLSEPDEGNSLRDVFTSQSNTYMEVEVVSGPGSFSYPFTMSPRQQIASVPYALDAGGAAAQMARDITTRLVDPDPAPTGDSQHLELLVENTWYGPFSFSGTPPSITVPVAGSYAAKVTADVTFTVNKEVLLVFTLVERVDSGDPQTVKVVPYGAREETRSGNLRLEHWRTTAGNGAAYSYELHVTSSSESNVDLIVNPYPETMAGSWEDLPDHGPGGTSDAIAMESGITIELIRVE